MEDVNDNYPVFYPSIYNVTVREDIAVGSLILIVYAKDADKGIYGQVN